MKLHAFVLGLVLLKHAYSLNCPTGSYLSSSSRSCAACPKGYSCAGDNYAIQCKPGYYADKVRSSSCTICPVGHYCYSRDSSPVKCPKGQHQDRPGQKYCIWCPPGSYNIKIGQTNCTICPVGHYCYDVDVDPRKCPKGEYQDRRGQRSCKWCKGGRYNLQKGRSTTCKSCPAGSMCRFVDAPPIRCSQGTYSPPESKTCFLCPSGTLCPRPYLQPLQPRRDAALKSKIHNVSKFAADAYKDKSDPSLNGLRLVDSKNSTRGFVKYDGNTIIVSFRGAKGLKDWVNNAKFLKSTYKACPGCVVHTGFSRYYSSVRFQMLAKVSGLSHAHPNSKVIVTGHSLGGGLATLAAVELAKAGYTTDLITYGAPRVGNDKFAKYADKTLKGLNLRVTYKNDIVTVTPPQLIGYRHAGQEMHYTDFNTGYKLPPNTDIDYNRLSFDDHKMSAYEKLK